MANRKRSSKLPTHDEMMQAIDPLVLCHQENPEYEVVRFSYERGGTDRQPACSIDVVFQHRDSAEQTAIRFHGVELASFPFLAPSGDAEIVIQNKYLVQHEAPRALEVRLRYCDGMEETLFWAGNVEKA